MIDEHKQNLSQFGTIFNDILSRRLPDSDLLQHGQDVKQLAADWAQTNVRVLASGVDNDDEIRRGCSELGLSPIFVDALLSSYDGVTDRCAALSSDVPFAREERFTQRVKDVAATVMLGGKPILCPFTGKRALVRDTIDFHTFLHRHDDRVCIVLPDWRVDQCASDRCWFFPEQDLILISVPAFDGRIALTRTAARVVANYERVLAYLADPNRLVMVSEDAMSHIGHYIWNIVSGWSPLYSLVQSDRIDILTSYPNWQIFGGVTELHPEHAARAGLVTRPNSQEELYDLMLNRRAISLIMLDRYIMADAAERIIGLSRRRCSDEFRTGVCDLRRNSFPLVMLTIRTGNRAWVEQQEGFASLIEELACHYPRLGIVLDGINNGMAQVATHRLMSLDDEQAIAASIIRACPTSNIYNSIGCQPHESIVLADAIDAFVAPIGAGLSKTRWVANKPGVGFSNKTFMQPGNYDGYLYSRFRDDQVPMRYVDWAEIDDVEDSRHGEKSRANFSMSWRAPLRELTLLLETQLVLAAQ